MFDSLALDLRTTNERDAALREPHDKLADGLQRLRLVRLKNYSYALD